MEGTEDGITLSMNDTGISCKLSKYLPQYIAKHMKGFVDSFLGKHGLSMEDMDFWAIHPGNPPLLSCSCYSRPSDVVLGHYNTLLSQIRSMRRMACLCSVNQI